MFFFTHNFVLVNNGCWVDAACSSLKHEAFMLGTSKEKHGGEFDLFITTAPTPELNDKINVFGRVVKGADVVQVKYPYLYAFVWKQSH